MVAVVTPEMLRECIQTVEEVNGDMDEGQPRFITTVLTCEGDLQDPSFPHRLESLVGKLNRLISEEKEPFCVEKVEPWNSVRVTFTIPWDAAVRLRELAQQGDQVLRDLGILSVQIEGDQVITLTLANRYSEPQEFVFKTSANADANSEVQGHGLGFPEGHDSSAKALGHLLSKAIKPSSNNEVASRPFSAPEESTVNGSVAFQSPNVVAPSNQSPPPFKTNAAALSQKLYTQNPVNSGPFPFASMTYAMNTKHAAANSQSTKHIQGCSSRFPFTPPLQRSASSAWMPYVSHKAVVSSSSTNTNIPPKTNVSQPNLLSASQHQNQYANVTVSSANLNSTSEVEETVAPQASKANNVLSSPLLVNLLQTETGTKFPHPNVSPVSSPILQPPAKRKRKPRKPKETNIISGRTSRSDIINGHTVSLPVSTNSTSAIVSHNLSIASTSKIQPLGKALPPYFPASSLEEQTVSNKSRSPLHKENSVLPNSVPFQSFPNSDFTVRNFQTTANSLRGGVTVVCTSASSAMNQPTQNSSPANNETKKIATDASMNNCTPFPSPPPSADGKVKHLINPFTGHLEPMPSDEDEDDECIGSLSLFPELEMMDTNDGAESDKNVSDRSEDKQKVPVSECVQGSQISVDVHPVKKDVIDALMCRKPDVYTVSSCASSASERNYSFSRGKSVSSSDPLKLCSVQAIGGIPKELKKSIFQKDVHAAVENPKVPVRSSTPITNNSNSPLPAQVSQVDLSFLQPHLQNWKAAPNKGKNANITYNSYVKPRVAENFVNISKALMKKHQENSGKVENPNVVVERPKYSYSSLSSSKPLSTTSEILKGSHSISDSFYALKTRISEHDSKISEFSVGSEKSYTNVNTVNLPVKDLPNTAFTRPSVFNRLTVLDTHSIDRANNTLKQVYQMATGFPKTTSFRKVQFDDKVVCHSRLGFPHPGPGNVETYGKDSVCVKKADEANVGINQSAESLLKKPIVHEANSKFSTPLNLDTYSLAASYNTSSPSIVVSSCDKSAVMSSQVNSSLFHPSPDSSDIKEFKQSPLERRVVSPESNPHFETPPDSRSPISSISSNDRLPVETVSSFDVIRKETLFNRAKQEKFLAEMVDSGVEIRRHNEDNSEQCSMSSLITPSTAVKLEVSMHQKRSENIPLCETSNSSKAIFSINSCLNTTYSGSAKIQTGEAEHSSKELLAALGEGKSGRELSCTTLFPVQDQSKSFEPNPPLHRRNFSVNYLSSSNELKRSGACSSAVSHSAISFQPFDDGTSLSVPAGYRRHDSVGDHTRKNGQQEGHFASGSVTKSSKTYDFMDNNISKPPEQLPLEIFENSESESQSPASSFDGESSAYFAGKGKHSVNVPSTLCGPIESHLSSQDHFSNTAPSNSSEKDVSVSSSRFVYRETLSLGACHKPLHNTLLESNLTVSSASELSGKCSASQATSDKLVNNPLSVVSNVSDVCAGGSVTTTSVADVPSSVSLSVPTISKALPKSTCESSRKFVNGSAFRSFHTEVSRTKNVGGLAALVPFQSTLLEKPASVALSEMGNTIAAVNRKKSKELINSFSAKVQDDTSTHELQNSEVNFAVRDNYPILASAEYEKVGNRFSGNLTEAGANGYADHVFTNSNKYDNGLNLNISDHEDSKLLLSRSTEIDPFPNYNTLAQKLIISSVDDKLVSEIKCKLNISRELNNKISAVDSSFSSDLQHSQQYENNNCVTIVSAEELHTASKKSNRSYSEDSFGDSSVESPYRNSDPLELEYNICDYKFDSMDRSLRPKHRNGSTCLIEDEANSPSEISGSLLFTSASDISGPNAKMVFQSSHEKLKTLNGRKDVNAACAIVEIRNASLFDGTKLLNPRKKCILSPRIGGEEQLQGIKRRRLSADSLR